MDTRGDAAEELQDDICSWKSLQYLSVHGCSRLAKFPEISGNIKQLDLSGTSIKDVPTIGCLSGLVDLALRNCSKLESLPGSICQLKLLEILQVDGTSIKELPSQIENLQGLVELSLSNCKDLVKLPEKIGHLKSLRKLDYLADSGFQVLGSYHFKDSYSHHLHFSFCFGGWDAEQGHPRSIVSDHLLLGFDPSLYAEGYEIFSQHYYNEVLIEFRFLDRFLKPVGTECKVKKCGARLAYAQDEKNASSMMRETKRCCDDNYYNEAELCGCGNDGSNKKRLQKIQRNQLYT
ncbi:hypothetical protein GH714_014395 [Hevea brasiliensis]|uniref:Disease resistance R13L4/SHOC-2-like LRR domain-containing protein n=1 Tax=Hevea brasiliensis TaxID=3981 RepID=A0A6A6N526_HEVBR|nr:hypothetical protein GH714_014395 [Hevea brasiliensis]